MTLHCVILKDGVSQLDTLPVLEGACDVRLPIGIFTSSKSSSETIARNGRMIVEG
jgi:hypothetical protein